MTSQNTQQGILSWLLLLTGFFILAQASFFIQCNKAYLFDFTFVSNNLQLPWVIYPELLLFIIIQLGLHLAGCLVVWGMVSSLAQTFPWIAERKLGVAITLWCWSVMTLLIANQYYFPNSKFVVITSLFLPTAWITEVAFFFFLAGLALVLLVVVMRYLLLFSLLILAIAIYMYGYPMLLPVLPPTVASASRPNIIIVGMDSLRPDFLSFFGSDNPTPFLDTVLSSATVFGEAVTPLARTFPAWASLLTGEYPRQTHIRSNLVNQQSLDLSDTLPAILRHQGYETIYATDEVRFSNMDKNFGFDQIIAPPMGLNDFLIGNFNDFPASNLLVNTVLGKWLFPHSYGNRAVYFTYQPDSFLQLIESGLRGAASQNKPLFLATHFCLPHHPWLWASLHAEKLEAQKRYQHSIRRVDRQVRDFFAILQHYHLLDHAIVVLLSDHGEALAFDGDRLTEESLFVTGQQPARVPAFYPPMQDDEAINQSVGHGTDVLGLPQYHTLLAFQLRGITQEKPQVITGVVSLLDIKPTILALLGLTPTRASGISLAGMIKREPRATLPLRHVFLESDYSPAAIRTVYPETRAVLLEGIDLFEIDRVKARLTIKKSMVDKIIKSKQLADIYGEWMLALYPQGQGRYTPILINLNSGYWTDDMDSLFARQSPAQLMLAALKQFYFTELAAADIKPFNSQPA